MSNLESSVSELMATFLDGLRALVPVFERAQLGWREEDAYDPWEQVAEALFKAIVGSAVDCGVYELPICNLPVYDTRTGNYSKYSYISEAQTGALSAFVCFETDISPFDVCLFAMLDKDGVVLNLYRKKVAETTFSFVARGKDGTLKPETLTLVYMN